MAAVAPQVPQVAPAPALHAEMEALFIRLGFTAAAAHALVADQGVDDLYEIESLDDTRSARLCHTLRKPEAGGHSVSTKAESNLGLAAYWLRHMVRVSKPRTPPDLTLVEIRSIVLLRETELAYKTSKDVPTVPKIDTANWPKTFEMIEAYLAIRLGHHGLPLAYVIRESPYPTGDPGYVWPSKTVEMIYRAPHGYHDANNDWVVNDTFIENSKLVFNILADVTRDHSCWTYVKPFLKTLDGRGAFLALKDHFLGAHMIDSLAAGAEKILAEATYNGEGRRWDFEKYTNLHLQQHTILSELVAHGYSGIDERSKVRYFIAGIKTDKLEHVKVKVLADPEFRQSFDKTKQLYQDYIRQSSKTDRASLNISEVDVIRDKKKPRLTAGDVSVEDRYYTKQEYAKLKPEQKKLLSQRRTARGKKPDPKVKGSKPNSNPFSKADLKKLVISAVKKQIIAVKKEDDDDDVSMHSASSSATPVGSANRINAALDKKRKTKK